MQIRDIRPADFTIFTNDIRTSNWSERTKVQVDLCPGSEVDSDACAFSGLLDCLPRDWSGARVFTIGGAAWIESEDDHSG